MLLWHSRRRLTVIKRGSHSKMTQNDENPLWMLIGFTVKLGVVD